MRIEQKFICVDKETIHAVTNDKKILWLVTLNILIMRN
jgi:hypothetical protein